MAKKIAPETVIKTWEEADAALRAIGEIAILVERKEGQANKKINEIKDHLAEELNPSFARKARMETDLEEFLGAHKGDLGETRSRKLNFGTLGFRKSPGKLKLLSKQTWAKVVQTLREMKQDLFLRFPDPEPDKEALKGADPEFLKKVGLKVQEDDNFWYEVDREKCQALTP